MRNLLLKFGLLFVLSASAWAAEIAVLQNGFSVLHDHHEVSGDQTRLFLDSSDKNYLDVPTIEIVSIEKAPDPPVIPKPAENAAPDLDTVVRNASVKTSIDADLLWSVIRAESNMNAHAISRKGARGLMQLMPDTANKLGVQDIFDPSQNVDGGSRYLQSLLDLYHNNLVLALAAYNAGPQRVAQYHGVPPFRETRAYVAHIVREFNRKKLAAMREARAHEAQVKAQQAKAQQKAAKQPSQGRSQAQISQTQTASGIAQ